MENIFELLMKTLQGDSIFQNAVNFTQEEDEDGNVTIRYQRPQNSKKAKSFKDYIDALPDDVFTTTCEIMQETKPESYRTLQTGWNEFGKIMSLEAIDDFYACVPAAAAKLIKIKTATIKSLEEEIKKLSELYLKSE